MVRVLVCSDDAVLSNLVQRNLSQRDVQVRQAIWDPCRAPSSGLPHDDGADLLILDLDCPPPDCWERAARLRGEFPGRPLILLTHDWPDRRRLQHWEPCAHVRKPFAIHELLAALRDLVPTAAR